MNCSRGCLVAAGVLLCLCGVTAGGEEFVYRHQAGDQYRIISTVREDVYLDHVQSHRAEILNRIAVEVTGETDGTGRHRAVFQTSERSVGMGGSTASRRTGGGSFQWSREYESEFDRDRLGRVSIDGGYFMPVVRDVPVFPGRDLKPGEKWSAEGHEMHDFRESFGIAEPYKIPFTAQYVFLGERKWKGRAYPAFSVSYRILSEPAAVSGKLWPRRISGASDQTVYWDSALGLPAAYEERFRMVFELSNGRTIEYTGRAEAEMIASPRMEKQQIEQEIVKDIQRLQIPDVTVKAVDEGIMLSMDNIQFEADTARMLPGEREKLDKIAAILLRYQERDILVGGHSARAGTAADQMKLSQERARVVADYLIANQVRPSDRVVVRGYGAEKPQAANTTEAGRRKNRRVEITILEN